MAESTHKVEVVPVRLEPHPNADSLSIVRVFGYTVCVRTEDWVSRAIGAYIVPDSVVPDTEQFAFLRTCPDCKGTGCVACNKGVLPLREKDRRIKAKKLRGIWSQGMLVPAPAGAVIGDDVAAKLAVTRYEPPSPAEIRQGGKKTGYASEAAPPKLIASVYDIENWYRYQVFRNGEPIIITEKIHGANFRAVFKDEQLHIGSHKIWKKASYEIVRNSRITNGLKWLCNAVFKTQFELNQWVLNTDWWWTVAREQSLRVKLFGYPGLVFYGEVYGPKVQDLGYGVQQHALGLVFYDVRYGMTGDWLPYDEARDIVKNLGLQWVPELYRGPYSEEVVRKFIDGNSVLSKGKQIREGIVIQSAVETYNGACGRVKLKAVSNAYLERATEKEELIGTAN